MKPGEVEAALDVKVRYEVPSDRAEPIAVNRGNPAVLGDAKGDFARANRAMASKLVPVESEKAAKRRWLGR
jgi:Flp pilus assembly CpaE family ATPase